MYLFGEDLTQWRVDKRFGDAQVGLWSATDLDFHDALENQSVKLVVVRCEEPAQVQRAAAADFGLPSEARKPRKL